MDSDPELREVKKTFNVLAEVEPMNRKPVLQRFIEHYSTFTRLRTAVAWLLRFRQFWIWKRSGNFSMKPSNGYLSAVELDCATLELVKFVQRGCFSEELERLQKLSNFEEIGRVSCKGVLNHSSIRRLYPVVVNGVLRLGGRLQRSPLPPETKHPILLPAKHYFANLIIAYYHCKVGHSGVLHTLSALREHFWIINGHSAVKRVVKNCTICRRIFAKPGTQVMAPLPKARVTPGRPAFTCVGLDFAGPFITQSGRKTNKRYLCLFTCMASRAVHLEIAFALDSDSFLQCFLRFCSRRITPEHVFSDNGSNFVGAERELRDGIRRCTTHPVLSKLSRKGVNWHFNPPGASHHGGVWERLIRSFRRVFTAVARSTRLDDQALITFAAEVEAILNDRPLTSVSADSKDLIALTPNALLKGSIDAFLPLDVFIKSDGYRKSWRKVGYMANEFWARWLKCYLPTLQQRTKWLKQTRNSKVGDLVLITDEPRCRGYWPMGLIEQ